MSKPICNCNFAEHLFYKPLCDTLPIWKKVAYTVGFVFTLVLSLTIAHLIYRFVREEAEVLSPTIYPKQPETITQPSTKLGGPRKRPKYLNPSSSTIQPSKSLNLTESSTDPDTSSANPSSSSANSLATSESSADQGLSANNSSSSTVSQISTPQPLSSQPFNTSTPSPSAINPQSSGFSPPTSSANSVTNNSSSSGSCVSSSSSTVSQSSTSQSSSSQPFNTSTPSPSAINPQSSSGFSPPTSSASSITNNSSSSGSSVNSNFPPQSTPFDHREAQSKTLDQRSNQQILRKPDPSQLKRTFVYKSSLPLEGYYSSDEYKEELRKTEQTFPQNTYLDLRLSQKSSQYLPSLKELAATVVVIENTKLLYREIVSIESTKLCYKSSPIALKDIAGLLPEDIVAVLVREMKRYGHDTKNILHMFQNTTKEINLNQVNQLSGTISINSFESFSHKETITSLIIENDALVFENNQKRTLPFPKLEVLKLNRSVFYSHDEFVLLTHSGSLEELSIGFNSSHYVQEWDTFKHCTKLKKLNLFIPSNPTAVLRAISRSCPEIEELTIWVNAPLPGNGKPNFTEIKFSNEICKFTIIYDDPSISGISIDNKNRGYTLISLDTQYGLKTLDPERLSLKLMFGTRIDNPSVILHLFHLVRHSPTLLSNLLVRVIFDISYLNEPHYEKLQWLSTFFISELSVEELALLESSLIIMSKLSHQKDPTNKDFWVALAEGYQNANALSAARLNLCTETFLRLCLSLCQSFEGLFEGSSRAEDYKASIHGKKAEILNRMIDRNQHIFDQSLVAMQKK